MYACRLGKIGAGEHRTAIDTHLGAGVYAVTLRADNLQGRTLIMLKQ